MLPSDAASAAIASSFDAADSGDVEIHTCHDLLRLLCFPDPPNRPISRPFKPAPADPFLRLLESSDASPDPPPNPNPRSAFVSAKRRRKGSKPSRFPPPPSWENLSGQLCTREKQEEGEEEEDAGDEDEGQGQGQGHGHGQGKNGIVPRIRGNNALCGVETKNHLQSQTRNGTNASYDDRWMSGQLEDRKHGFRCANGMGYQILPDSGQGNVLSCGNVAQYGIIQQPNGSNGRYGNGMKNGMAPQLNGRAQLNGYGAKDRSQSEMRENNMLKKPTKACKNLACKAEIPSEDAFCRRCSCSICEKFDDNKDPSLWIICNTEIGGCGLSSHIECALEHHVAGVVGLHKKIPTLDGSYFCQFCGTVTPLISSWKKQLKVAKDARRVDVFRDRLLLSHRLLKGTKQHKDYHSLIDEAVSKLEAEVSKMGGGSSTLSRCIVNRLSCIAEVQKLINLAVQKADETKPEIEKDGSQLPGYRSAPCVVHFGDVSSSSIVISVREDVMNIKQAVLGYKLWHRRTSDPSYACAPTGTVHDIRASFTVLNLHPLTEYTFKVVLFTAEGDLMHSEAGCSTKAVEDAKPPLKIYSAVDVVVINTTNMSGEGTSRRPKRAFDMNYRIDELENGSESQDDDSTSGFLSPLEARTRIVSSILHSDGVKGSYSEIHHGDELTEGVEACNLASQGWAMQIHTQNRQHSRRVFEGLMYSGMQSALDRDAEAELEAFEFSVKVIRWLECEGHLRGEFRMKFLTWYTLRATEHEKEVVSVFISTLGDDPISLARQLVDAFEDIIVEGR